MILSINFYFFYNLFKIVAFFKKKGIFNFCSPLFVIPKADGRGICAYYLTDRRYTSL